MEFERAALDTLAYLFVPPLRPPRIQPWTLSGAERRDAVFPNRERDPASNWGLLHADHGARMILVEFKNYDKSDIGPEQVAETSGHLRQTWGRLGIMCCSKQPTATAIPQTQHDLQRGKEAHPVHQYRRPQRDARHKGQGRGPIRLHRRQR
jgi:hypothetical protein